MPETTGVVTFEDVLLWAAEQGALTKPCGLDAKDGASQAVARVREVSDRARTTPTAMRTFDRDGERIDASIDFILARDSHPTDKAQICLDQQLSMTLDQLIGGYGWSVRDGLDTPVNPREDINYICTHEIENTTPPPWSKDYFVDDSNDDIPVTLMFEGRIEAHPFRLTDHVQHIAEATCLVCETPAEYVVEMSHDQPVMVDIGSAVYLCQQCFELAESRKPEKLVERARDSDMNPAELLSIAERIVWGNVNSLRRSQ